MSKLWKNYMKYLVNSGLSETTFLAKEHLRGIGV